MNRGRGFEDGPQGEPSPPTHFLPQGKHTLFHLLEATDGPSLALTVVYLVVTRRLLRMTSLVVVCPRLQSIFPYRHVTWS